VEGRVLSEGLGLTAECDHCARVISMLPFAQLCCTGRTQSPMNLI